MAQLKVKQVVNLINSLKEEIKMGMSTPDADKIAHRNGLITELSSAFLALGAKMDKLEDIKAEALLLERELFNDFPKPIK